MEVVLDYGCPFNSLINFFAKPSKLAIHYPTFLPQIVVARKRAGSPGVLNSHGGYSISSSVKLLMWSGIEEVARIKGGRDRNTVWINRILPNPPPIPWLLSLERLVHNCPSDGGYSPLPLLLHCSSLGGSRTAFWMSSTPTFRQSSGYQSFRAPCSN